MSINNNNHIITNMIVEIKQKSLLYVIFLFIESIDTAIENFVTYLQFHHR